MMLRVRSISVALGLLAVFVLVIAWGMGGQETAQGAGSSLFGNGSAGSVVYGTNQTFPVADAPAAGTVATNTLTANNASFAAGQRILIHQTVGTNAGDWELNEIQSYAFGSITTATSLAYTYSSSGGNQAQVLVMPQYSDVTVSSSVTLSAKKWNASSGTGGILAFLSNGTTTIDGTISADGNDGTNSTGGDGLGFDGGAAGPNRTQAWSGEGIAGPSVQQSAANGNGGGGGKAHPTDPGATGGVGGGGGNGTPGLAGVGCKGGIGGAAGSAAGSPDLSSMVIGGGGGGGGPNNTPGRGGGAGGGVVVIIADTIQGAGLISSDGGGGPNNGCATAGGGAGGSVLLRGRILAMTGFSISAVGGPAGISGAPGDCGGPCGDGGDGRIRLEYCDDLSGGASDPSPPSQAEISCGPKPTPTKQPFKGDTDGDGCPDVNENLPKAEVANGGGRDYMNPWDFYDVNGDGVIDLLNDILGVIQHHSPFGAPPYGVAFDRGPTTGPNAWNMTAPDGVIDLLNDILGVITQFDPDGCT